MKDYLIRADLWLSKRVIRPQFRVIEVLMFPGIDSSFEINFGDCSDSGLIEIAILQSAHRKVKRRKLQTPLIARS